MNLIIREYYDSGDADETIRCLKELNVPHFFHEFVYKLMDFSLEKNTERLVDLLINKLNLPNPFYFQCSTVNNWFTRNINKNNCYHL
jgi:hypothetical protein